MSNITCAIWKNWQTTKMPIEGSKMMRNSQISLMVKKEVSMQVWYEKSENA